MSPQQDRAKVVVAFLSTRRLAPDEMDSDEEEEDDDDDEFEFSTSSLKSRLPHARIVLMKLLPTGSSVHVKCRLPWTWPWLQATLELRKPGKSPAQQLIDGTFSVVQYHLDPSQGVGGKAAIALFLKDITTTSELEMSDVTQYDTFRKTFCDWLSANYLVPTGAASEVRLNNLANLLDAFAEAGNEGSWAVKRQFEQLILSSTAGRVWSLGTQQPCFFRAAPLLFPRKIMSILPGQSEEPHAAQKKQNLLQAMEEVAENEPWKMGYADVMYRETNYSGLEAQYGAMRSAWFFCDLPAPHQDALLVYDAIKQECRAKGHTFVRSEDLKFWLNNYLTRRERYGSNGDTPGIVGKVYDALLRLVELQVVHHQVVGCEERFHLSRYWRAEEGVCSSLHKILTNHRLLLSLDLEQDQFARLDTQQLKAARSIMHNWLTIVSGRGGTGKTEVVSAVLSLAEKQLTEHEKQTKISFISEDGVNSSDSFMTADLDSSAVAETGEEEEEKEKSSCNGPILYCAPTGKAASVIKKRVGKKAFTIHQILASYKLYKSNSERSNGPWRFAATRILAVDECSMVSVELFHWLLKYLLEATPLEKIVLLGDHLQLPSVDPGNFMADLCIALESKGLVIELKTNHRSEGSLIFSNASLIAQNKVPEFDRDQGFRLIVPDTEDVCSLPHKVRRAAERLSPSNTKPIDLVNTYKYGKSQRDHRQLYWSLLRDYAGQFNMSNDETSQMISFTNRECAILNQFGCYVYNKHCLYSVENSRKWRKRFEVSDKIMCTKNADVKVYELAELADSERGGGGTGPLPGDSIIELVTDGSYIEANGPLKVKQERLMNGSLYKIRARVKKIVEKAVQSTDKDDPLEFGHQVTAEEEYFVLDDMHGEIVRASVEMLKKKCKIAHAWALSIHKFQGSEADSIVYVLSGSGYETWQHVYTAVTRGKKHVVIIATYADLEKAVRRKPVPRQTALGEKVRKLLSEAEVARRESQHSQPEEVTGTCIRVEQPAGRSSAVPNLPQTSTAAKVERLSRRISKLMVYSDNEKDVVDKPENLEADFEDGVGFLEGDFEDGPSFADNDFEDGPGFLEAVAQLPSDSLLEDMTQDLSMSSPLEASSPRLSVHQYFSSPLSRKRIGQKGVNDSVSPSKLAKNTVRSEVESEHVHNCELTRTPVPEPEDQGPVLRLELGPVPEIDGPSMARVEPRKAVSAARRQLLVAAGGKRSAVDSPASYLRQCQARSPATYMSQPSRRVLSEDSPDSTSADSRLSAKEALAQEEESGRLELCFAPDVTEDRDLFEDSGLHD